MLMKYQGDLTIICVKVSNYKKYVYMTIKKNRILYE